MPEQPGAGGTLILGPLPQAGLLGRMLLAFGRGPLIATEDPATAASRARAEALGLLILRDEPDSAAAARIVRALRFDARAASRRAGILVLAPAFTTAQLQALRQAGVTMAGLWPAPEDKVAGLLAAVAADRRRWIEAPAYCGPDRRTRSDPFASFVPRRAKDFG